MPAGVGAPPLDTTSHPTAPILVENTDVPAGVGAPPLDTTSHPTAPILVGADQLSLMQSKSHGPNVESYPRGQSCILRLPTPQPSEKS